MAWHFENLDRWLPLTVSLNFCTSAPKGAHPGFRVFMFAFSASCKGIKCWQDVFRRMHSSHQTAFDDCSLFGRRGMQQSQTQ